MNNIKFIKRETHTPSSSAHKLVDGSRVAVIGGGPAGSFFSYFLLGMAERAGIKLHVDIFEPRDFDLPAPRGCNMCGGVIYESLVQSLAVEGINLTTSVVQRGIEFNMLHLDIGSVRIQASRHEKRIATVYRGSGPRDLRKSTIGSFDGYLMKSAIARGAHHIRERVEDVRWFMDTERTDPGSKLMQIKSQGGDFQTYELLAVASGVNTAVLKLFHDLGFGYQPPKTTKLFVREYKLGQEVVTTHVGPVFHAFLLDIPGLDYGAIIPKGDYVTVCLLSSHGDLEAEAMETFLNDPTVKQVLPPDFSSAQFTCHCGPRINVVGCAQPFGDRIVFIGDSGVSRLYKDGIGAAYRAAKIAASTAVFQGVSAQDFKRHYLPFCRKLNFDNQIGKLLFRIISQIQTMPFARRAVLRMVSSEQRGEANAKQGMSALMWDMLTGGAPYQEVLMRALHPAFWTRFLLNIAVSLFSTRANQEGADTSMLSLPMDASNSQRTEGDIMNLGALGKVYQDGETIIRKGEIGDCMYVIQDGCVEAITEIDNQEVRLAILGKDEFFGEMAIFDHEVRSATVRALGPARILTVDHKNFLRRIHEDPSLAYRMMEVMSSRLRNMNSEVTLEKPSMKEKEETNIDNEKDEPVKNDNRF